MGIKGTPKLETLLQDMMPEESGYTSIYAVRVDPDGKYFVDISAPIRDAPDTLKSIIVPVKRTGIGIGEYNFDFRDVKEPIIVYDNPFIEESYEWGEEPNLHIVPLDCKDLQYQNPEFQDTEESNEEGTSISSEYDLTNAFEKESNTQYQPAKPQPKIETKLFPDDKEKFPKTHSLRSELNTAINKENFEKAEKLKRKINSTQEKL